MTASRPGAGATRMRRWGLYAAAFLATSLVGGLLGALINMEPGEETTWDARVAAWVTEVRPGYPGLTLAARAVTRLGNVEVTATALTAIVLGLLLARWRGWSRIDAQEAPFWLVVALGGQLMNWGLKLLFRRDRPPSEGRLIAADFYSFPSGHGMFAGVSLMLVAMVVVRTMREHAHARIVGAISAATLLALAVAASRVWLGVHYLSDVVVGFLLGLLWGGACHWVRFGREAARVDDPGPGALR